MAVAVKPDEGPTAAIVVAAVGAGTTGSDSRGKGEAVSRCCTACAVGAAGSFCTACNASCSCAVAALARLLAFGVSWLCCAASAAASAAGL